MPMVLAKNTACSQKLSFFLSCQNNCKHNASTCPSNLSSYILLNFALVFLVNMRTNWQFLFVNRELNCHYTIKSCTLYTAWTRLICKPSLKKELPILMWSMRPSQKDLAMNIWHLNWYLAQEHLKCVLFLDLPIEFLHCWSRAASLACFFAFSNSFCWKKTSNI